MGAEALSPWAIASRVYNSRGNTILWVGAVPTVSWSISNYILSFLSSAKFQTLSKVDFTWWKTKAKTKQQNKTKKTQIAKPQIYLYQNRLYALLLVREYLHIPSYAFPLIVLLHFLISNFSFSSTSKWGIAFLYRVGCLASGYEVMVSTGVTPADSASYHNRGQGQNTLLSPGEGQPEGLGW